MSVSSSNKKIKELSVDRLSALPDDILCYILSFLEMKEAAITCLLSKRWQFLWTNLPGLRFVEKSGSDTEKKYKFVIRVHRILVMCSRRNLQRFEVDLYGFFNRHILSFYVNVWVGFAIENEVKEFSLLLPGTHVLPQTIYSNPSWTSLRLRGCIMPPRGTIQWHSLTALRIDDSMLNEITFAKILAGCPVLSSLDLCYCRGYNVLEVDSPSLRMLAIKDYISEGDLRISAPYVRTLKIHVQRSLILENIKSLVRAEIKVCEVGWDATHFWNKILKQRVGSILSVKMLNLGQFLSLIVLDRPLCNLEIHAYCGKQSISGILSVLESSPNIETLVLHFHESSYQDKVAENEVPKYDLNCDFFLLKTIEFKDFRNPNFDTGESMRELARILLKRAIFLEKMTVNFSKFTASSSTTRDYSETS